FMKRSWRAITAASFLVLCGQASAETSFDWGGQGNFSAYGIDQDDIATGDANNFGFAAEGKVWGRVKLVTDSGVEYGARAQLRFQSSEHEFSNDFIRGAPEFVDEVWIYVQTAFGGLKVGLEDGAADSAGMYAPSVSDINSIDDARAFPLQDPLAPEFTAYMPNGAHLRTDLNASGDALKIIYTSPRLIGLQLTGSYTPDVRRGLDELFDDQISINRQSDIWEVGLNYQGSLSSFDVGFYAGYVTGSNDDPAAIALPVVATIGGPVTPFLSNVFVPDDLEEWGAGAQVAYEGFKVGGSYRSTNIAGGAGLFDSKLGIATVGCTTIAGCVLPDARTEIWGAGITYETGPWEFGVNYVTLDEELPAFTTLGPVVHNLSQEAEGWAGAIGYEFDENLRMGVGYQHYKFEGPANACVSAPVAACDTLDANLAYFETSITF
ncbi:MAG: porin, partial [Alphaproteobacteria bacterium]|nr:porin [Alphaproteobacteria bacterium]